VAEQVGTLPVRVLCCLQYRAGYSETKCGVVLSDCRALALQQVNSVWRRRMNSGRPAVSKDCRSAVVGSDACIVFFFGKGKV